MDAGYLTTGQVARLMGVSKGTILRAVQREDLWAAWTMPGGGLRFDPADIETYAGRVASRKRLQPLEAVLLQRPSDSPARQSVIDDPGPTLQSPAKALAVQADQTVAAESAALSASAAGRQLGIEDQIADILALLADSLQVGLVCLARPVDGAWLVEQCHDRMGMALRSGAPLPFSEVYGQDLRSGLLSSLLVEDIHADARFAVPAAPPRLGVGAMTIVSFPQASGQFGAALCALHPYARSVPSGETALLRLAGRMVMHAREAARLRDAQQQATRLLAASEARFRAVCDQSCRFHSHRRC